MSDWKKVKIGDVCKIVKGSTGIASAEPGEYPLVVTAEERKSCSSYQFDCEAVCIPLVSSSGHGKKSLKNVHYQSGKFALGTILCAVIPNDSNELDARFLRQYLQFYKDKILVPLMKGAANVSLSMKDIATVEIPLPPIEKQRELSELFVSLQEKEKILNEEYEKQFEYTKQLRQNILQDAIEGRLTEEWRKSNPVVKGNPDFDAEALFEKIQEEKCHTDSELPLETSLRIRNSKKKKVFEPISENEQPFEIPEGWKWVRLGEIVENITSGSREWARYYSDTGAIFLRMGNLSRESYVLRLDNIQHVRVPESSEGKRTRLLPFDLLFSITAEIGNLGLIPKDFPEAYINQHTARIRFAQLVKQSL
ncbi:MAG: restriction endonuclease subunit S, partial [Treponema sp.]|nr:restriction endonuclease subunit S [Treponema sp.]